jgi:hypothetical protein
MRVRATLIGTIAVSVALVVPIAQADSPYDWPGGIHRIGVNGALQPGFALYPDNRSAARGPGAIAAPQEGSRVTVTRPGESTPQVVAESQDNGFDWGDAVVGAAVGVGAAVLSIGCAVLLISQRARARTA